MKKYNIERKYLCAKDKINEITHYCETNGHLDENCNGDNGYTVTTVYKFVLQNNGDKRKIRLRKYSTTNKNTFFVEMKAKNFDSRFKIRKKIDEKVFLKLSNSIILNDFLSMLKIKESYDDLFKHQNLMVQYFRKPWILHNNNLRITYDKLLKINNETVDFDCFILEIKANKWNEYEIIKFEKNLQLKNTNFSKFKAAKLYIQDKEAFNQYITNRIIL